MRGHSKTSHKLSIKEYGETFGSPRFNIISKVWHKCELCQEDVLLDSDEIHKHAFKHRMSLREYNTRFIVLVNKSSLVRKERRKNVPETEPPDNADNIHLEPDIRPLIVDGRVDSGQDN